MLLVSWTLLLLSPAELLAQADSAEEPSVVEDDYVFASRESSMDGGAEDAAEDDGQFELDVEELQMRMQMEECVARIGNGRAKFEEEDAEARDFEVRMRRVCGDLATFSEHNVWKFAVEFDPDEVETVEVDVKDVLTKQIVRRTRLRFDQGGLEDVGGLDSPVGGAVQVWFVVASLVAVMAWSGLEQIVFDRSL